MSEVERALCERSRMLSWARRWTLNRDDAEDLVQATCLKALENEDKFLGGNVYSWLYVMMRNICFDKVHHEEEDLETITLSVDMSTDMLDIQYALMRLSEKLRSVMILYSYGYSLEEISRRLRCKEGTVASRIHNAKRQMFHIMTNNS